MLPIDNNLSSTLLMNSSSGASSNGSMFGTKGVSGKDLPTKETQIKDSYLDQNSLNAVKTMGRHNDPQALKEIAKKFEGMFVQQMLKSMREANEVFSEGDMLSSDEGKFHQEMLDQQMVLNLTSGKGIGLATSMYQQMQKMYGKTPVTDEIKNLDEKEPISELKQLELPKLKSSASHLTSNMPPELISRASIKNMQERKVAEKSPEEFIASLMPFAEKAAAELHVNTDVILAQAALETGWGKHLLRDENGNNSFNVFNIKKNAAWDGKSVGVKSLEYKEGVPRMEHSEFRQYENYTHSFSDYVDLLKSSPRYQRVLEAGNNSAGYADALKKSGYATDPLYAEKLKSLINSDVIRSAVNAKSVAANATELFRG